MINYKFWQKIASKSLFKNKYFELREDQCRMPNGQVVPKYFVFDFPDWVQIVARDRNKNFILVNQYRYPGEGNFLEFPGGSTEPSRTEEPLIAAQRELCEETGFESKEWKYLGAHFPNPALMSNKCHVYLAENCDRTSELDLDPFEVLEVAVMSRKKFEDHLLKSDKINSLMLATYQIAQRHLKDDDGL